MTPSPYQLRPVTPGDEAFLLQVYSSTRAEEMTRVDWIDEQKTAFLRMQFDAQTQHYKAHYPSAKYLVIEHDGAPVGRLTLEYTESQHLIMDIILLPKFRRLGIGTAILTDLMNSARQDNHPLVLRVEFFNPAVQLYSRLGFVKTREVNSVYQEMIWTPNQNTA
ncbi:MAG: GNAT family N-acetyltransferase [Chloroflexi bacterium]|nr:GNAT family N-acetyltransferase [Chloroflexota bacterium]